MGIAVSKYKHGPRFKAIFFRTPLIPKLKHDQLCIVDVFGLLLNLSHVTSPKVSAVGSLFGLLSAAVTSMSKNDPSIFVIGTLLIFFKKMHLWKADEK